MDKKKPTKQGFCNQNGIRNSDPKLDRTGKDHASIVRGLNRYNATKKRIHVMRSALAHPVQLVKPTI
jgi:hypothetical protein